MTKKMKKLLWLALLNLSITQSHAYTFHLYNNARFNYQIAYPTFLIPQGESANSDGQIIKSDTAKLIVWGSYMPQKIEEALQDAKDNLKKYRLTISVIKPTYFILSGESDTEIAYFKTKFICGENINFQLYYPKSLKKAWDPIVTEISKSLQYSDTKCRPNT